MYDRLPSSIMIVLYWLVLSYGRVSGSIVYMQGESHGHMILHGGGSYSAYTVL